MAHRDRLKTTSRPPAPVHPGPSTVFTLYQDMAGAKVHVRLSS